MRWIATIDKRNAPAVSSFTDATVSMTERSSMRWASSASRTRSRVSGSRSG